MVFFFRWVCPSFGLLRAQVHQAGKSPCMLKRSRSLHYRLAVVPLGTRWGTKGFNGQTLQPKTAAYAVPFHYDKPQSNAHLPAALVLLFTATTQWSVKSEEYAYFLVRCISSPIILFSGSSSHWRLWAKKEVLMPYLDILLARQWDLRMETGLLLNISKYKLNARRQVRTGN